MLVKVELTAAWAHELGWTDADIENVFDIAVEEAQDSPQAVCLKCGRQPVDFKIRFFKYNSATETAESVPGRAFVNCVCGTWYSYAAVDKMNGHTLVGQSHVPAAVAPAAPKPAVPPLTSWAPVHEFESATGRRHRTMDSNDVVLEAHRQRRQVSPALWVSLASPQWARVASTNHLRQSQAADQPPDSPNAEPGEAR